MKKRTFLFTEIILLIMIIYCFVPTQSIANEDENDPRVKYSLLNFRANRFVELKMTGKVVQNNFQCGNIIKSFKIDPLKYQALIQTNMYVPYSFDRWWLLNSSRFPDFDQFVAQVNAVELDYTILDTESGLCELLKTPLIQEGELIPGGTNGPGCLGCAGGS